MGGGRQFPHLRSIGRQQRSRRDPLTCGRSAGSSARTSSRKGGLRPERIASLLSVTCISGSGTRPLCTRRRRRVQGLAGGGEYRV